METRYSENLDTLIALATNLALTRHKARTPSKLAKTLSLNESDVLRVLETFKGLFRKSRRKKSSSGEHYYTLQLRCASDKIAAVIAAAAAIQAPIIVVTLLLL